MAVHLCGSLREGIGIQMIYVFRKKQQVFEKIDDEDRFVQLVPIRSIPDSRGNIKVVFGPAVEISHVVANGGINYFAQNHIAPLR